MSQHFVPIPGEFAICQLTSDTPIPEWPSGPFVSITRTSDELSIVCLQESVPTGVKSEGGWSCLRVAGTMDFSLVGVVASITRPIASANIGVFVVSTYDTDYVLIKTQELPFAIDALVKAGHTVEADDP